MSRTISIRRKRIIRTGLWFVFQGLFLLSFLKFFYNKCSFREGWSYYALYSCLSAFTLMSISIGIALCIKFRSNNKWRRTICDAIYLFTSLAYIPLYCCLLIVFKSAGAFNLLISLVCIICNFPIAMWVNRHIDLTKTRRNRFMAIWFAVNNLTAFCFVNATLNFESETYRYLISIIILILSLCGFCMLYFYNDNKHIRILKYLIAVFMALLLWSFLFKPILFLFLIFYAIFNCYAVFKIDIDMGAMFYTGLWFVFQGLCLLYFLHDFYNRSSLHADWVYVLYSCLSVFASISILIGIALCIKLPLDKKLRQTICDAIYLFTSVIYIPLYGYLISEFKYIGEYNHLIILISIICNFSIAIWVNRHIDIVKTRRNRFMAIWFAVNNLATENP